MIDFKQIVVGLMDKWMDRHLELLSLLKNLGKTLNDRTAQ